MKTAIACSLLLICGAVAAQNLSDQDINLMLASTKTVQAYKQGGMTQTAQSVEQCYGKLAKGKPIQKDVEFCIAQDLSAVFIDSSMAQVSGFPRDQRFTDEVVANRIHGTLTQSGLSKSAADTQRYLGARNERVQRFTNRAIAMNDAPKAANNVDACVKKKLTAWDKSRSKEIHKYCDSVAKRGEECRISAGMEEEVRREASEKITQACQNAK